MNPIPPDSPIQFLIEITMPSGTQLRMCTGLKDIGNYSTALVDLTVTDAPRGKKALSIQPYIRRGVYRGEPVRVQARIGVILAGETVDDAAVMYEGDAILS